MAFDGVAVYTIVNELADQLIDGRIDKIYQPEKDEIHLSIRTKEGSKRLLMTCSSNNTRLHLTTIKKDNPPHPPMFCMLLRKHLNGGRIIHIHQLNFDRIVEIQIESTNEMGDLCTKKLIIEIMGKHSNIILADDDNKILDSIKHVNHEVSSVRMILPGLPYILPPSKDKLNPLEPIKDEDLLNKMITKDETIFQGIYHVFSGFSPVISQEILSRAELDSSIHTSELTLHTIHGLNVAKDQFIDDIKDNHMPYRIYFDQNNQMLDFSSVNLISFNKYKTQEFPTFSETLEYFYKEKDKFNRIRQKSYDLKKFLQNNLDRCVKKKSIQEKQIQKTKNRDKYKLYGELITANIYGLNKGMTSFQTMNYYDESCPTITIPLDANLTPSENAQRYFKRYNKAKRTEEASILQLEQTANDIQYFESLLASLELCENEQDLTEIREELYREGYIKRLKTKGKAKSKPSEPIKFITSEGIEGMIGKNNRQNDQLTFKMARTSDLWFHTKDIPGSHVALFVTGKDYSQTSINEAAMLAGFYSKAKNSSNVPVDYTERRHVKKPNGSKPGFVIYFHQTTLYVTPDEDTMNTLIIK